jgi:hypothetical protein
LADSLMSPPSTARNENAKAVMWLMPACARTVREHEGSEATINAAAINVLRSIMPITRAAA